MSTKSTVFGALAVGLLGVTVSSSALAAPRTHLDTVCAKEHASDVALKAAQDKFDEVAKAEAAADAALKAALAKEKETDVLRAQAAAELAKAVAAEKLLDSKEARAIAAARRRIVLNSARIVGLEAFVLRTQGALAALKTQLEREKNGQAATCGAPQLDPANKDKYTKEDISEAERACAEDKGEVKALEERIAQAEAGLAGARRAIEVAKVQNVRLARIVDACKKR